MYLWVLYNEHRQIYREPRQFIWWNKEVVGNLWTSNTRIKTWLYLNEDKDTLINPGFISTISSLIQTYFGRLLGVRYCSTGCDFSSKCTFPCPQEAGILVARIDLSIICPFYSIWICVCIISLSSYRSCKGKFSGVWKEGDGDILERVWRKLLWLGIGEVFEVKPVHITKIENLTLNVLCLVMSDSNILCKIPWPQSLLEIFLLVSFSWGCQTLLSFHTRALSFLLWFPPSPVYFFCREFIIFTISSHSVQLSSVTQSCPTPCDPMNRSMPGLPVHHQPPEFTQTHVPRVSDAIQPSHPLSSPSPPAPNPSQHQSLFQWVNSSHEVAKVLELQL